MSANRYWLGKSGTRYPFALLSLGQASSVKAGGVYMFVRPVQIGEWMPVYIGSAGDLSSRLENHERWVEAAELGATHLMVHPVAGKRARAEEERDLTLFWQPALSAHSISPDGIAAIIRARRRPPSRNLP